MTETELSGKARKLFNHGWLDLVYCQPGLSLNIIQKVVEDLTALVEEYEALSPSGSGPRTED